MRYEMGRRVGKFTEAWRGPSGTVTTLKDVQDTQMFSKSICEKFPNHAHWRTKAAAEQILWSAKHSRKHLSNSERFELEQVAFHTAKR